MHLHLSPDFDGVLHLPRQVVADRLYAGPRRLLEWLEAQLGRSGFPEKTDYLRIEFYRQALQQHLESVDPQAFYHQSFDADRFSTAHFLLNRRDELLLAGWSFVASEATPDRLRCLASVEVFYRQKTQTAEYEIPATGAAERWDAVLRACQTAPLPVTAIQLYDPEELLPAAWQRLLRLAAGQGIPVRYEPAEPGAPADTDLGHWQRRLAGAADAGKIPARADGSLLLVRAGRDAEAAAWTAALLARNPELRPLVLLPEMNRQLEQAMLQEGLPALGILSASMARPALQVLKLAPAFLWEPVDVYKIMEFVTLPVKPIDEGLAQVIGRVLAEKPGLFSDTWYGAVLGYLERSDASGEIRRQYDFWFDRRRYPAEAGVPRREAIGLYTHLQQWALKAVGDAGTGETGLLVLAEQARRIRELLEALPDARLGYLELERIVRTIYEPAPMQLDPVEEGRFDFVHTPGAIVSPVDRLMWWNFRSDTVLAAPDFWRADERAFLGANGAFLERPDQPVRRTLHRQREAILRTAGQLILVCPERVNGADVSPHLLLGDLDAAFSHLAPLWCPVDDPDLARRIDSQAADVKPVWINPVPPLRPRPHLQLPDIRRLLPVEYETVTQLESMLYYPHRWFFRQHLRLYPANLLRISADAQLLGNLGHRFLEMLLVEDLHAMTRSDVYAWIDAQSGPLLEREGAPLLLYGREPERKAFQRKVQQAAWTLVSMLRQNGWTVAHTELPLEGELAGLSLRAKADLVLQREGEWAIVDFKWGGARRRREMIRNNEDLQLMLYAYLLPPPENWPHTAYYILEEGRMIARNRQAFREAQEVGGRDDHAAVCRMILDRIVQTYRWRQQQIMEQGLLELRTARTAPELSALYGDVLDLLEMKEEDAKWDDYRFLIA
ncbi:MAG: PD-(D/E)XK nuclease family protein [Saprospiraceae bacterium]|nr:PD-(D/E)XK nuclease family protein [Saprospiraceae bacterium]